MRVTRARKVCRIAGCPHLQPCPAEGHEPRPWAGSERRSQLPGDWATRRRIVLARDAICTICNNALSTEVHHVGARHDHSLDKLAGVCTRCHKDETQQQAQAARRGTA